MWNQLYCLFFKTIIWIYLLRRVGMPAVCVVPLMEHFGQIWLDCQLPIKLFWYHLLLIKIYKYNYSISVINQLNQYKVLNIRLTVVLQKLGMILFASLYEESGETKGQQLWAPFINTNWYKIIKLIKLHISKMTSCLHQKSHEVLVLFDTYKNIILAKLNIKHVSS